MIFIINTVIIVRFIAQKRINFKIPVTISSHVDNFSACYTVLLVKMILSIIAIITLMIYRDIEFLLSPNPTQSCMENLLSDVTDMCTNIIDKQKLDVLQKLRSASTPSPVIEEISATCDNVSLS